MQRILHHSLGLCVFSLFILIGIQPGCVKEDEIETVPFLITNLSNGDAYERGSIVSIHFDVDKSQSDSIVELRIFIDGKGILVAHDFPCYYEWNTKDEAAGFHLITLTSCDCRDKLYSEEYHLRLFEKNTLACPGAEMVTDWDGNEYKTIKIGDQCWMKENLKTTHYADGSSMIKGSGELDTRYDTTSKYYFIYEDDTSYIETYGLLYIWKAAVNGYSTEEDLNPSQIQGVCPDGWHLPSDSEWKELEMYMGMAPDEANDRDWRGSIEGGMLKESGTTHWASPNNGATNESGFTALPAGLRTIGGEYESMGIRGTFWTSTNHIAVNNTHNPAYRRLHHEETRTWRYQGFHDYITYSRSVRCVKDE